MYTNPKGIREHEVKIRFNEEEAILIDGLVNFLGTQKAVFIREMALEHIKKVLSDNTLKQIKTA